MAESNQLIQHLETYVDVTRSATDEAASLEVVVSLVKKNELTMEKLVQEMELYLTATDNVIRARGILLLAEVLKRLESKPLHNTTIHSLIGFFADRLADWRALRGALVGCLALIRRKSSVGMVSATDAQAVSKSFSENLQVQSLAQYDRQLCFELLECLLESYPEAVRSLGETLVYHVYEAIDGEKDPDCLILAFHIVEVLAQVFPDPYGPLATNAADLFEVLGCYFPLHFTHPKGDVKRDDLSRALMLAFSSTPLFEPFAIPLLLEKLSSSLPVAKVDSLKYLNDCVPKYGVERMAKHYGSLWSSLKETVYASSEAMLSFTPESLDGPGCQENEIAKEALNLLQRLIVNDISFLSFVAADLDINTTFDTITSYPIYEEVPQQSKQKLHATSQILSVSGKASIASCNRVFEIFFLRLTDILGISVKSPSGEFSPKEDHVDSYRLQHSALYLFIELIAASRNLILGSKEFSSASGYAHETWCSILKSFSLLLTKVFTYAITVNHEDIHDADIYLGVKGLLILGTFPGEYSLVSKSVFEKILMTLISIIVVDYNKTLKWKLSLKALVLIGLFINQFNETEKALSYMKIVVDKIASLVSLNNSSMPYTLKLEAISEICASGPKYMSRIFQGFEEALHANLSEIYVHENAEAIQNVIQLLDCLCNILIPRIVEIGGLEEILLQFAFSLWNQIETCITFKSQPQEKGLIEAVMTAMKLVVGNCSVENQNMIIQKAFAVVSSSTLQLSESAPSTPVAFESLQLDNMSSRDEWIISLFTSVIVAVSPQAHIPNVKSVIHLFLISFLRGHVAAAQALGSMVNKLGQSSNGTKVSSDSSLDMALNIIFHTSFRFAKNLSPDRVCGNCSGSEMDITKLCFGAFGLTLQIHAITGLAWIGKGLLMRGHERVQEIILVFLKCLKANNEESVLQLAVPDNNSEDIVHPDVMKCAADAFQILMCDSDVCLNRKFHAVIRPLYKQRFFSIAIPLLEHLIMKSASSLSRHMVYQAFAHVVTDTPLRAVLDNSKKLIPMILEGLSILSEDILGKDTLHGLLLVLSGILTDKNGHELAEQNAHIIINCLVKLTAYPHIMLVRETAIQCLVAMVGLPLPHRRIYPFRTQVLQAVSKALDDPKRSVRQEAIRCRQAWASIASRSLHC